MSDQPKAIEPVPVQLTRVEGKIDLLVFQVTSLTSRVDKHDDQISDLEKAQAAQNAASNSWKSWLPIIISAAALVAAFAGVISFK